MPTTTKMGIVYPASSDLVKDGATAMGTISTTVDSKSGLVLLNTTSFSAVASQSINDIFSTNFTNYRILINGNSSIDERMIMRVRVSGSDNTSSVYGVVRWNYRAGSTGASGSRTDTSWTIGALGNSRRGSIIVDIFNPFATANTSIVTQASSDNGTYTYGDNCAGTLDVTTSYTGFTIAPNSGTITGTVTTFGYNV